MKEFPSRNPFYNGKLTDYMMRNESTTMASEYKPSGAVFTNKRLEKMIKARAEYLKTVMSNKGSSRIKEKSEHKSAYQMKVERILSY